MGVSKLLGSLLLAYSLLQPNSSNALCDTKSYFSGKDYTIHGKKGPVAVLKEESKIGCEYPPYAEEMLIDYGMDDVFDCIYDVGYDNKGKILNKGEIDFEEFVCTDNGQLINEDNTVEYTNNDFILQKTNFLNEYAKKIINATKNKEVIQISSPNSDNIIYMENNNKSNFIITKNKKSNDISLLLDDDGIEYTLNKKGHKYSFDVRTEIKEKLKTEYRYIISMEDENTPSSKIVLDKLIESILSNLDIKKTGILSLIGVTQKKLDRIYTEEYCGTLVIYNTSINEGLSETFEIIKNGKENYSKLGISYLYFVDKEVKDKDNNLLGGRFYSLIDSIHIYAQHYNPYDVRHVVYSTDWYSQAIYHEIAHSIYKNFFESNQKILNQWTDLYDDLRLKNILSSDYAYTNASEGFAEEYAYYKLNKNPKQSQIVKAGFEFIDELLQGGCEQ